MKVLCIDHVGSEGRLFPSGIYEVKFHLSKGLYVLEGVEGVWNKGRFKVLEEPATGRYK